MRIAIANAGICQSKGGSERAAIRLAHEMRSRGHSVHLLTSTDLSPSQISDSLGFSSVSYFRKVLRQHTGQSPLQIRKTQTPLP